MNAETLARITKEAEEYAALYYGAKSNPDLHNQLKEAYIAGATAEAERSEKLREDIESISEYIDVCGDDYDPGELLIKIQHKINSALNEKI